MSFAAPAPLYLGPPSKSSGNGNKPIRRIVLHGTVSPCVEGGARDIARYFRSDRAGGSAHYIVDPAETVQSAYDSVVAWHAPPNPHSIGVEICDPVGDRRGKPLPLQRWDAGAHKRALERAADLVAELCLAYDVPATMLSVRQVKAGKHGICEHSDVSQAFGQSSHWDVGLFPRLRFQRLVRSRVTALKLAAATPATTATSKVPKRRPAPKKPAKASRVDLARDLLRAALKAAVSDARKRKISSCIEQLPEH